MWCDLPSAAFSATTPPSPRWTPSLHPRESTIQPSSPCCAALAWVCVSETEEGHAWAGNRIKRLTDGDPITARFMRENFCTYVPQFKWIIVGNHKLALRNVDDAICRRFNLAPFVHKPTVPDKTLEQLFLAEHPAILRWMIDGCLDWQMHSLIQPAVVTRATSEYLAEEDTLAQWSEECCVVSDGPPHVADKNASLFASWRNYCAVHNEDGGSQKAFSGRLHNLGYVPIRIQLASEDAASKVLGCGCGGRTAAMPTAEHE
jgi:putative DNA primase/helicase